MLKGNKIQLPVGTNPKALEFSHFPTRQQAVVWRNWELVSVKRLAQVLETSELNVAKLAEGMGLRVPPVVGKYWLQRGYTTIIRNNWHLLPYEQLLTLLGWTPEKLAYTLKEDDFLWNKMGQLKPHAEPVRYAPLTPGEERSTANIKKIMARHFPDNSTEEEPFAFLEKFREAKHENPAPQKRNGSDLRLVYSYSAVYGDPLLEPEINPYPDGLLERLSEQGINGVWLQGILYTLVPWEIAPELSAGWEKRIENLQKLCRRAEDFGIGVYLYLNEPRSMPQAFFEKCPEWKGMDFNWLGTSALCTSNKDVRELLYGSCKKLFEQAPELSGVFTISMSENPTNCYSKRSCLCPRCSQRKPEEVIAEVNATIEAGVHAAKPDARVIVWTWGWQHEWAHAAVDLLPAGVELMCVSEEAMPTDVGGVKGFIRDYSISQVGPGETSTKMWEHARRRGIKTVAKIQMNNSWECSAVPYLPVPDLVEEHLKKLSDAGINNFMVTWTLGGYPAGNMELLGSKREDIARNRFGEKAAPIILQAWHSFSEAFKEFPFSIGVLYVAPQNYGPMNLLFENPTGFAPTMVGFPYDGLKGWKSIYPEDVFERQFEKLSTGWKKGLELLDRAGACVAEDKTGNFSDLRRVASAAYCHFRSTYLQIRFVRLRDAADGTRQEEMNNVLREEIEIAETLEKIVRKDSRIGFEATNHYCYTVNDLREKVLNCLHICKEDKCQE